jgi:hypothetical protein
MRFKRADLVGILFAALAPVAAMVLFLAAFEVWGHHGTPLLGFMSANIAIAVGLMAAFTRFIKNWDFIGGSFGLLVLLIATVIMLQRADNDGAAATSLKWAALIDFLVLNIAIGWQVLNNGLMPVVYRRDARLAAEAEE